MKLILLIVVSKFLETTKLKLKELVCLMKKAENLSNDRWVIKSLIAIKVSYNEQLV